MKKNLLIISHNSYITFAQKPLRFLFCLVFVLVLGATTKTQAQCTNLYFYQAFEGFGGVITGPTGSAGLVQGVTGTNYWTINGFSQASAANSYTGSAAATLSASATSYIITPKIAKLKDISFWYRRGGISVVSSTLAVEYSTNYNGTSAGVGSATWNLVTNLTTPTNTAYTQYVGNININDLYIRIRWSAGAVSIVDDLGWTSTNDAENTQIILPKVTGTCLTPAYATPALLSNIPYTFYDQGGATDGYSLNQDQTVTFTPASGERIKVEFITNNSGASTETFTLSNTTTNTSPNPFLSTSNNAFPPSAPPFYSNYCTTATIRYQTSAIAGLGTGFNIRITSDPAAVCSGGVVANVPTSTIAYNVAAITWPNLGSGCSAPIGYDYYISTSSTPPTNGAALPASSGTALQTGYIANSGAGATGATVTGLAGSTLYYGWVRRNCTSTFGNWTAITNLGGSFTTLCAPVAVTPSSIENFTGLTSGQINTSTTCLAASVGSFGIANAAGNDYFFNAANNTWFFSKPLTLDPTKIYRVSFDYANSASQATTVQAFYGKTDYNVLTNNPGSLLATVSTSSNTFATSKSYFQPSTASTYYVGIRVTSLAGGAFLLDNLRIEIVPCWPASRPTAISGTLSSCPGSSVVYTATPGAASLGTTTSDGVANASSVPTGSTWTVPTGWLVTAGQGTNSATVTTGIIPGNVSAVGDFTGCDSSLPFDLAVTSSSIPAQPSAISASSTNYCTLPTAGLVFSVTNAATSYVWSFPAGWTITAGGTTNSVTVTATAGATSGTITVTPSNGSCQGTPRTLNVTVGNVTNGTCASPTPITSSVTDSFRCGVRNYYYAFTVPTGCTDSYKINLAGTGGDIDLFLLSDCTPTTIASSASGANSESITSALTAGVTYYIRVFEFVTPAGAGGSFTLSIAPTTTLGTPAAITGPPSVACSSITTTNYSIAAVSGASSYTWTVPAGWTLNSGQGTTSISITTNGSTAGNISVVAVSACGTSLPSTRTITVGQVTPGAISGPPQLCSPFTNTTYTISAVSGATSYTWTVPSGWSVISGAGTLSITVMPSSNSGTISVTATGPCGTSPASTYAVVTAASVVTTGALICSGSSTTISAALTTLNTFNLDVPAGSPTFVRPNFLGNSSGNTVMYTSQEIVPTVTGSYTFAGCDSGGAKDTYLVIYNGSFSAATPLANFLAADDDANGGSTAVCNFDPRITVTLTAGQTYVLVATLFSGATTFVTNNTITVTPPPGGGVQFGQIQWYSAATGGTLLGTGSPFDPGVGNYTVPATYNYYGTNSLSSFCRTLTTIVVSAAPTQSITPTSSAICPNSVYAVSANATGTGVTTTWTSTVGATLYSNALGTIAYVPLTNAATVYVKSSSNVTVTAVSSVGSCSVTSSVTYTVGTSKTWDGLTGLWSPTNTAPTINEAIIINNGWPGVGPGGDLQGCSCTVNSGNVIFTTGQTLTLTNELTVLGGTVTFDDESNLHQTGNVANTVGSFSGGNSGNITYRRTAQPMFRYDYTYWSSPVFNQNLLAFSPSSPIPLFYQYNYTGQAWQYINPISNPMEVARGYAIRAPLDFNTNPGTPNTPGAFTGNFTGIPNNGTITYPITTGANQLNLIGNPYASAIFANDFIQATANNNITGTLYFWTHNTYINAFGQYVQADYASYNLSGGVASGPSGTGNFSQPLGYIASGQGFFVRGITGAPNGIAPYSVTFANSMRRPGFNNRSNFYRNSQVQNSVDTMERHRFWLNIESAAGGFKQVLIGYVENATNGIDRMFDGEYVDVGNAIVLYSIADTNLLTIQARQLPFDVTDIVPLGYKSLENGNYTINIDHFDTYFNSQDIYLEDKLLGIIHNLKNAAYTFSTEAGTFNDRFQIRYSTDALGVGTFDPNAFIVYKNTAGLHINSGNVLMKNVKLFDITGRLIASRENIGANETVFTNLPSTQQVLLVHIITESGEKVTKKVVF